jgi:hypothetical protein
MKTKKQKAAPRSTLAIAGKKRPPKVEKLNGDELPPPEEAAKKRRKQSRAAT